MLPLPRAISDEHDSDGSICDELISDFLPYRFRLQGVIINVIVVNRLVDDATFEQLCEAFFVGTICVAVVVTNEHFVLWNFGQDSTLLVQAHCNDDTFIL